MKNILISRWVLLSSLGLLAVACGRGVEADSAEDADESVSVTSSESALTTELSDEVTQPASTSTDQLASAAAARIATRFTPSGCVTSVVAGSKVTYTLTNCTGPYGLVSVSGTLVATYSRPSTNAGGVQVVITGSGIQANKATFDVNATVVASQNGSTKTANVTATSTGTGPRGVSLKRNGTYTVTFDSTTQCATVNGSWSTDVGAREATTTVTDYQRCKGTCAATGTIVHSTLRGATVTVAYNGTSAASWSTTGGRAGTVNLLCSPK